MTLLRYHLAGYSTRTSVAMLTLLSVALAIDLARFQDQVLAIGEIDGPIDKALRLAWYCALRSVDITTRMLGIAAFLGVLWWEFSQNRTGERVAIWNAGITPLRALVAPLAFGLLLTGVQASLEFWLRPTAVLVQIDADLGAYGKRYSRSPSHRPVWFMAGVDLVAARVDHGPPISLHDVIIYRLSEANQLLGVVTAASARPTSDDGIWTLTSPKNWEISGPSDRLLVRSASARADVQLAASPLWLQYRRIPAKYLPQADLVRLVRQNAVGVPAADYETWETVRYSGSLLPALFVVMAFTIGGLSCGRPPTLPMFMMYFSAGFLLHILWKNAVMLAEFGVISPLAASALPIATTVAILAIAQMRGTGPARSVLALVLSAGPGRLLGASRLSRARHMSASSKSILGQTSSNTRSSMS